MEKDRVTLAWKEIKELDNKIINRIPSNCSQLDLSHNSISDLSPLSNLKNLDVLVLDNNRITENTKIPLFEGLHTLWVNSNRIANLSLFLDKLVKCTPNLRSLSMLQNDACPNFFNGGSLKQYTDYRYYIISRIRVLEVLDSTIITQNEREEAFKVYGTMQVSVAREEQERKILKEIEQKRKEEKLARRKRIQEKREKKEKERQRKAQEEALQNALPKVDLGPPPPPSPPSIKLSRGNDSDWTTDEDESDWSDED